MLPSLPISQGDSLKHFEKPLIVRRPYYSPINPSFKLDARTILEKLRPLILASVPLTHHRCSNTLRLSLKPNTHHTIDQWKTKHWKTSAFQHSQQWKHEERLSTDLKDLKKSQNYLSLHLSPKEDCNTNRNKHVEKRDEYSCSVCRNKAITHLTHCSLHRRH